MDQIDRQILSILKKNARTSLKTIAEKTYLSSPAVSARLDRMEKEGIIKGYSVRLDAVKLGYHVTAFINLEVDPDQKQVFYPYMESCPNVLECSCVTGNYSMLIKAAFPSTAELDQFIGQLQRFGRTSTQIVFSTHVGPREVGIMDLPATNPGEYVREERGKERKE